MLRCPIAIHILPPLTVVLPAIVLLLHHIWQLIRLLPVLLRKLLLIR